MSPLSPLSLLSPSKKTWGLVLSGGAAWGIANAGVLEVLEREHLRPDYLAGSSMGAIVGALWAVGHPAKELKKLCSTLSIVNAFKLGGKPLKGGLHGGLLQQALEQHVAPLLGEKTVGDCEIPFICVAGRVIEPVRWEKIVQQNFTEHFTRCIEEYVFPPETRLIDAIMASSALPVLFQPVHVGADSFIDLVSFGAIPVKQLKDTYHPDVIITTNTNPDYKEVRAFLPKGWRQYIEDGQQSIIRNKQMSDLVIRPVLKENPFRFDKATVLYEAGKKAAEKSMRELTALLQK